MRVGRRLSFAPRYATLPSAAAIFLTYRDGKIVSQHNYDCFDPWQGSGGCTPLLSHFA